MISELRLKRLLAIVDSHLSAKTGSERKKIHQEISDAVGYDKDKARRLRENAKHRDRLIREIQSFSVGHTTERMAMPLRSPACPNAQEKNNNPFQVWAEKHPSQSEANR